MSEKQQPQDPGKIRVGGQSSLIWQFNKAMALVYIAGLIFALGITHTLTQRQAHQQAEKELTLLVDMVQSLQRFVAEETRGYFIDRDIFFSPVVSSTVAANIVANKFQARQPDFHIRVVSDNPLNANNRPEPLESALLNQFRASPGTGRIVESGNIRGRKLLVSAAPEIARAECLACHGSREEAPAEIIEQYNPSTGFGYQIGQVVGASVVGVPLATIHTIVIQRSLIVVGLLTLLFAIVFLIMNRIVNRVIVKPVVAITESAHAVSRGQVEQPIRAERNDEIGDLGHSFELLRRSLVFALKRYKS